MKAQLNTLKRIVVILGVLLLVGAAFLPAFERPARKRDDARRPGHRRGDVMQAILSRLDLTEDQRARVRAIVDADADRREDLAFARIDAARALRKATHQSVTDVQAVKAASAAVAKAELDIQLHRAQNWAEMQAVLTDAQKQTVAKFLDRMEIRRQERIEDLGEGDTPRRRGGPFHRMLERARLTESQKVQVKAVLEQKKADALNLRRADIEAHAALQKAALAPVFDPAAVTAASRQHAQAHEGLALHTADTFAAIYAILDQDQRARLDRRMKYAHVTE